MIRDQTALTIVHPRSAEYVRARRKQTPMCSLQPLTYLQVQVLPRQWMVGPSSDSRLRLGETPAGASSAVNDSQRREGEANRPRRAKTGQRKLIKPNWTEFVRLADQAVVAFAGADMINRAEPRACGYSRRFRRLDKKWPETGERQLLRQTKPRKVSEGRRRTRLTSSRTEGKPAVRNE